MDLCSDNYQLYNQAHKPVTTSKKVNFVKQWSKLNVVEFTGLTPKWEFHPPKSLQGNWLFAVTVCHDFAAMARSRQKKFICTVILPPALLQPLLRVLPLILPDPLPHRYPRICRERSRLFCHDHIRAIPASIDDGFAASLARPFAARKICNFVGLIYALSG
jgi:hypothetical protein